MKKTQLLFACTQKTAEEYVGNAGNEHLGHVRLNPVGPHAIDGDDAMKAEVASFYRWTPGGGVEFSTINAAALAQFEEGALYRITIERYTAPAAPAQG